MPLHDVASIVVLIHELLDILQQRVLVGVESTHIRVVLGLQALEDPPGLFRAGDRGRVVEETFEGVGQTVE